MKKKTKKILISIAIVLSFFVTVIPLYIFTYDFNLFVWRLIPTHMPDGYTITAHSGCEGTPANSMESIRKGYELGVQVIEVDVNFTEEGFCVLSHDSPQIGDLTLEEAFAFISAETDLRINLDLKSTADMGAVYNLIKKYGLEKRAFFTGVGTDRVEILRQYCPGIGYYIGFDFKNNGTKEIKEKVALAKELGALGVNIHYSSITSKLVKICHENGMLVSVYTIDKPAVISHVLLCAPDNITTRRPIQVMRFIEKRPH